MSYSRDWLPWSGFEHVRNSHDSALLVGDYGESMTVQSQAEDADLNVMLRRMNVTGQLPVNPRVPTYGDFTGITDFRSALHAIRDAEEGFAELTAETRAFFNNDPQALLEFAANPDNLAKMREMGLAKERVDGGSGGSSGPAGAGGAPGGVPASTAGQPAGDPKGAPGGSGAVAGGAKS